LSAPPDPLAAIGGPTSKGKGEEERKKAKRDGREGRERRGGKGREVRGKERRGGRGKDPHECGLATGLNNNTNCTLQTTTTIVRVHFLLQVNFSLDQWSYTLKTNSSLLLVLLH